MTYLLIAGFLTSSLVALTATFAAGYIYAQQHMMNKMAVDAKRREKRLTRNVEIWQGKLLEKVGAGGLRRRLFSDAVVPPSRHVVAPSQAINELKKSLDSGIISTHLTVPTVPVSIGREFLEDAGRLAGNAAGAGR